MDDSTHSAAHPPGEHEVPSTDGAAPFDVAELGPEPTTESTQDQESQIREAIDAPIAEPVTDTDNATSAKFDALKIDAEGSKDGQPPEATPGEVSRGAAGNPTGSVGARVSDPEAATLTGPTPDINSPPVPRFAAPSSYLRAKTAQPRSAAPEPAMATQPAPGPFDKEQLQGLRAIRDFLKVRTSYDVLPLSFRLIVLDTTLLIKKSLNIMIQNSIVSAPLWDSGVGKFAGILTSTDYLNLIQYYCQFPDEMGELEQFRLSNLRTIEKRIGAEPIETISVHPSQPLYEACRRMLRTRARRIPLIDVDGETEQDMIVSVITQYRILKFIAVNNEHNTVLLKKSVRELKLGTYTDLSTISMTDSVIDAVRMMVSRNISCVPIIDKNGKLLNVFEAVDIIPCIKDGAYEELDNTVGDALCKRSDDSPGIYTCGEDDRLESIFDTIRKSRVHRLIVVDDDNKLKGVMSLSDILKYVLLYGEEDESMWR